MQMQLEEQGHTVRLATDGLSALHQLKDYTPVLIFIDLIMPNIDGKKLCQMLRSNKKYDDTFLVMLSAISTEENIDFRAIGFNACIAKGPLKVVGGHIQSLLKELEHKGKGADGLCYENENLSKRGITKELLSTKRHFELILSNMSESIFEMTADGTLIYLNGAALQTFNVIEEEVLAKPFVSLFSKEQQPMILGMLNEVKRVRMLKHMHPPVQINDLLLTFDLIAVIDDTSKTMVVIMNNRTEQYKGEEILRQSARELEKRVSERTREIETINSSLQQEINERKKGEKKIQAALQEKELLLKEIHHRVKNNLQVISSLLGLQARQFEDPLLRDRFTETQNRVHSISIVHEKLYQSDDLARIKFEDYISNIVKNLLDSYGEISGNVKVEKDIEDLRIGIDIAIPCGLIINELVSNSLKHAFPEGKRGKIIIQFRNLENSQYILSVRDNGIGIASEKNRRINLGMKIINTLVKQLRGDMTISGDSGSEFSILIPIVRRNLH